MAISNRKINFCPPPVSYHIWLYSFPNIIGQLSLGSFGFGICAGTRSKAALAFWVGNYDWGDTENFSLYVAGVGVGMLRGAGDCLT